jgi:hypothetical protein
MAHSGYVNEFSEQEFIMKTFMAHMEEMRREKAVLPLNLITSGRFLLKIF